MPFRQIAAFVLIALVLAAVGAVYLYLTRGERAYARALRGYRRARKGRDNPPT